MYSIYNHINKKLKKINLIILATEISRRNYIKHNV